MEISRRRYAVLEMTIGAYKVTREGACASRKWSRNLFVEALETNVLSPQ